jgi:hypothetical protein
MSEEVMEYLTMTRIMGDEWQKWLRRRAYKGMTGMEHYVAEEAYKAGFMAGFEGKYFGEKND